MSEEPGDWSPFTLVLIDVQKDFWTEFMTVAFPDYEENIERLLALCRGEGIDVVHLRAQFRHDQADWMARYRLAGEIPCIEDTDGVKTIEAATESDGEPVIVKQTFDGFLNDDLDAWLRENGKRYALPHSRIMIHQPLGGFQGQATDIEIHAKEILLIREKLNKILARHTGQELPTIERDTDRDNFMSAEESVAYGLIDQVLDQRPARED